MTSAYASSILRKTLCHASQSQKLQNQPKRAKFPKNGNHEKPKPLSFMLLLFALLCGWPAAWGQTEWNGTDTNGTFTISSDKQKDGNITIPQGHTLILNIIGDNLTFKFDNITLANGDGSNSSANLNLNVYGSDVTLSFNRIITNDADSKSKAGKVTLNNTGSNFKVNKRYKNNRQNLFYIARNWSLEVIGTTANPVTFDGEWTMDETGLPTDNTQISSRLAYGVFYSYDGDITFKNVKVKNFVVNTHDGNAGVFRYSGNNLMIMNTIFQNVEIFQCYAGPTNLELNEDSKWGRIIALFNGIIVADCDNLSIHHCFVHEPENSAADIFGMGGVIRSQGSVGGTFTINNSTFHHNIYKNRRTNQLIGQGGAINWRAGVKALGHEGTLVIKNSTFYNNKAMQGGAIATNGALDMQNNVEIKENEAVCGGGVYFWAYNGMQPSYDGRGFDAIFGNGVKIHDNTATEYGGGAFIGINASDDVGFEADHTPMSPLFQVQINTGSKIYNNKAPRGAGIAIRDSAPYSHYFASQNKWSLEYRRTITIDGGEVYDNYAQGTTGSEMAGAGIYIEKYPTTISGFSSDYNYLDEPGTYGAGTLTVNAESGLIYGNTAINGSTTGLGGGMYIASNFTDNTIVSTLNVNIGKAGKDLQIYNNQAYTDGGGVYVLYDRTDGRKNEGTVTVAGGTIGKTDLATGNKALHGNGGGICVMSGTVVVENGHVDYNTANQNGGGIYLNDGDLTFTGGYVEQNEASEGDGGGICVMGGTVEVDGGHVDFNTANQNGGGIYLNDGNVTVKGGTIGRLNPETDANEGNKALTGNGGGICVMGGTVEVDGGHVDHNTANQNGGGIYLYGGDLTFTGGNVEDNEASNSNGGGICVMGGTVEVDGGHVDHNTANQKGGGIYLYGGDLTFTGGSVDDNEASNSDGGGICVEGGNIVVSGGSVSNNKAIQTNGGGISVLGGTVLVEGGNIITNTAKELGGGVYVSVPDATTITKIQGGANISSNSAKGGGGVYVDKGILKVEGPAFASGAYGQVQAEADNTHTRITKNTASDGNGGGINAGNGEVDLTNTLIYNNTASGTVSKGRGGGVYLDGGIIKIVSSKILYNTAETNGGGIDDHSGDIEIYGGDISHNIATTGRGGGVYTNAGDIRIWPTVLYGNPVSAPSLDACKNTGTLFSYNKAGTNGGGLNTHIGRLDVRFANVHHNEAGHNYQNIGTCGGSGGGMFCEGPHADLSGYTVRLLHTYLDYNKAFGNSDEESNLTGRGGGLYLKYGSIFAEHCYVRNNEADINGGGLDNHDGELRVYGTFVEDNEAKNGKGGGLYTDKGNLVVGPCDSYGFVESKASRICNNTAYINGGGINNHEGDITIHGDRINNNTAVTGDGGGVYINSGQIYMYGGQINNNKADNGKGGGVYGGGGTFNIMEREAHPILEILEVEDITTEGFTIHFHHVDRGYAMKPTASDKEYGIAFSESEYPSDLGENEYWGDNWQGVDTVKVGPTNGIPFPAQPHTYNQNEGCSRFIVHDTTCHVSITPNTTYYVVAYGKYTYGGKDYFDASPAVAVKTHGNNPVVVTGVAFDITTNSASVNGKLFYEGVGTLLAKGIEISSNYGANWEKHPAQSVGDVFSVTFSGLEPSRIYKARAYAISQNGGNQYESQDAEIITFFTLGNSPVVATGEASEITTNSATVSGELLYEGVGSGTVTKGIRYKTGENEWTSVASTSADDEFSVTLTGLDPGTTYQAQAYATKGENTVYGEIITFTTATGSKAPQGPRSVYPAVEENPFFQELTPLQQAIMASTPEEDTTTRRSRNGRPSDDEPVNIPEINYNTATYGGGICIDKKGANLIFSGNRGVVDDDDPIGQINYNYASEAGGGIYIGRESADKYAQMQMMGKCEVNKNRVPAGKLGGGIYLDGRFYVGDKDTDLIGTHGLKVDKNFAITKNQTTFESELAVVLDDDTEPGNPLVKEYNKALNNVFLPRNEYDYYEHATVNNPSTSTFNKISVLVLLSDISGYVDENNNGIIENNETTPHSHIGFSVLNGFCPVIATAKEFGGGYNIHTDYAGADPIHGSEEWLFNLMCMAGASDQGDQTIDAMRGAVFEDSESYVAVHTRRDQAPFCEKYIYLWGCWTHPIVMDDPETKKPMKGSDSSTNPASDPDWQGHYVITNPEQNTKDGKGDPLVWEIYSAEGLSWFTSYVNGLNDFDEKTGNDDDVATDPVTGDTVTDPVTGEPVVVDNHHKWYASKNPKAVAKIMNDLDMSAYLWVPIGSVQKFYMTALASEDNASLFVDSKKRVKKEVDGVMVADLDYTINAHYYEGTFDGQGHIIKGLQGLYLTGIEKFGLFGYLNGATIINTFVDNGLFVSDDETIEYASGGIAGRMQQEDAEGNVDNNLPAPSISNSEARMRFDITYSKTGTHAGGLVGDMQAGSIHSCMAMPEFNTSTTTTDQYVGGLVGKMDAGTTLKNSFSNVLFTTTPDYNVGGIVGENNGLIENVYVRYRDDDQVSPLTLPDNFYWFVGNNPNQTGGQNSINFCYAPDNQRDKDLSAPKRANNRRGYLPTDLVDNKYGFAHKDQQMVKKSDWSYDTDVNNYADNANGAMVVDSLSGLLRTLNKWVKAANKTSTIYTPWTRTMASKINDDYPVLQIADFNVVGSEDGIYMKYDTCVNRMWETDGKNFNSLTKENNPKAAMYLYNTNYDPISITNNTAVRLYIHENVGITQTDGAELHARVGVTFDNSNKSLALGGKAYDWHMFSSALQAAPMGLTYNSSVGVAPHSSGRYQIKDNYNYLQGAGITHKDYTEREYMDPPVTTWNTDAGTIGYFPTNTPYGTWGSSHSPNSEENSDPVFNQGSFDFYCFHEESRHWINFKREGTENFKDHWHQDIDATGTHRNIPYINEETMKVGKGYMMGVSAVSMLMADGILNNGAKFNVNEPAGIFSAEELTNSDYGFNPSGYSEELRGTNLVGNPFQSYLDFDKLVAANSDKIAGNIYYVFDADSTAIYLSYTAGSSDNHIMAPGYLHPHQGFFVKTANGGNLTFNNDMRAAAGNKHSHFRDGKLNYPLVNLFCYDAEGHYDVTTVEMNRPELGGGSKLKDKRNGNSLIYARMENEDYQTLFAPTGTSTVPVRFEPSQDGVYTMRWGTLHGDFHYLHLVDNMSGADVDMLRSEEYRFEATTSDYISRFKLVFEVTGLEEEDDNEDDNGSSIVNFAFRMGDELIVNGEGYFELFDVQGRRLTAKRLVDAQSSVSLPNVAAGIYFLRLSDDKQVRTQKMVINY